MCNCKCYKSIEDFPVRWRSILSQLNVKEDLVETLLKFNGNWDADIMRLTIEIGSILSALPVDIRDSWEKIKQRDIFKKSWQVAILKGEIEEAEQWKEKYINFFECKGCSHE